MAEIHEFENEEVGELEAVAEQIEARKVEESAPPEDDVPEEFKGMSAAEIARIAKHARREMGRQANELGEIRKLADELIKSQLQPKVEAEKPKEVDFFENPQEAIKRAVETNPAVLEARQYAIQAQQAQAKQQIHQMHPDMGEIIQDPEFAKWVGSSPVRQNLLKQADAYDLAAAHELLSTFKELRGVKQQRQQQVVSTAETKARDKAMQAAAVDTGGSGESTRKVYRRADLIRLMMTDRAQYDSRNDEFLLAYKEGRVK